MKSFEERKKEYFEKLRNDSYVWNAIINDPNNINILGILIDPKDDKELELGEYYYNMMCDLRNLIEESFGSDDKKIAIEENAGVKYAIKCINLSKESKEKYKEYISNLTPSEVAEIMYSFTIGMITDIEELYLYIAHKVGVDFNNPVELAKMNMSLKSSNLLLDKNIPDFTTEEGIIFFKEYVNKFHELCTKTNSRQL